MYFGAFVLFVGVATAVGMLARTFVSVLVFFFFNRFGALVFLCVFWCSCIVCGSCIHSSECVCIVVDSVLLCFGRFWCYFFMEVAAAVKTRACVAAAVKTRACTAVSVRESYYIFLLVFLGSFWCCFFSVDFGAMAFW